MLLCLHMSLAAAMADSMQPCGYSSYTHATLLKACSEAPQEYEVSCPHQLCSPDACIYSGPTIKRCARHAAECFASLLVTGWCPTDDSYLVFALRAGAHYKTVCQEFAGCLTVKLLYGLLHQLPLVLQSLEDALHASTAIARVRISSASYSLTDRHALLLHSS